MSVKEYGLRFVEANLSELRVLNVQAQRRLLELITQVELYIAHVADARDWFKMTFDQSLNEANRAAVEKNLASTYRTLAERARIIIQEVGEVERSLVRI